MNVTIIHGQKHKGNTYKLTEILRNKICTENDTVEEFFVNGIDQCIGCANCIMKGEQYCPHYNQVDPIIKSMDRSNLIIITSPNYCMGMTGQLKTFFDHLAYRWMSHRPNGEMHKKVGIAISTAAGIGANKVTKMIRQQLFWLYTGEVFRKSFIVKAYKWEDIKPKRITKLEKDLDRLALKIIKKVDNTSPSIKTRVVFKIMSKMQERESWNDLEKRHWMENGWIKS